MHFIWKHAVCKPIEDNSNVNLNVVCSDEISKHRKYSFQGQWLIQTHCPNVPPCSCHCDNALNKWNVVGIFFL